MYRMRSSFQRKEGAVRAAAFADERSFREERRGNVLVQTKRFDEPVRSATRGTIDPGAKDDGQGLALHGRTVPLE
jgi:hypothetical protein